MGFDTRCRLDTRVGNRCTFSRAAFHSRDVARSIWLARCGDRELGAVDAPQVQPVNRLFAYVPGELGFLLQRNCGDYVDEE